VKLNKLKQSVEFAVKQAPFLLKKCRLTIRSLSVIVNLHQKSQATIF